MYPDFNRVFFVTSHPHPTFDKEVGNIMDWFADGILCGFLKWVLVLYLELMVLNKLF